MRCWYFYEKTSEYFNIFKYSEIKSLAYEIPEVVSRW